MIQVACVALNMYLNLTESSYSMMMRHFSLIRQCFNLIFCGIPWLNGFAIPCSNMKASVHLLINKSKSNRDASVHNVNWQWKANVNSLRYSCLVWFWHVSIFPPNTYSRMLIDQITLSYISLCISFTHCQHPIDCFVSGYLKTDILLSNDGLRSWQLLLPILWQAIKVIINILGHLAYISLICSFRVVESIFICYNSQFCGGNISWILWCS